MKQLFDRNGKLCGPELDRRAALCEECMSEHCAFNPEGICTFPLIFGRKAMLKEDTGCLAWLDADEMDDRSCAGSEGSATATDDASRHRNSIAAATIIIRRFICLITLSVCWFF